VEAGKTWEGRIRATVGRKVGSVRTRDNHTGNEVKKEGGALDLKNTAEPNKKTREGDGSSFSKNTEVKRPGKERSNCDTWIERRGTKTLRISRGSTVSKRKVPTASRGGNSRSYTLQKGDRRDS